MVGDDRNARFAEMGRHPRLSVIVPTVNEVENLRPIVVRLDDALSAVPHEIVIVDDASTDGTADLADALAATRRDIRVLYRPLAERGLSSAIVAGFVVARGSVLAVIDADLQHDPQVIPQLLAAVDRHDLAIGSRYTQDGRTCRWSPCRKLASRAAAWLTRKALVLTIRDPLSGCFAIRQAAFLAVASDLRPRGWKLLLDIVASDSALRIAEVPMTFHARTQGRTKMNARVVAAWLWSLAVLRFRRWKRTRATARQAAATPIPAEVAAVP